MHVTVGKHRKNPDTQRIVEYVRRRLQAVVLESDTPHGKQAELARTFGVSPAHISNVLAGKVGIGEHLRRAALPMLGFNSMAELEAAALNRPIPAPPGELDYKTPEHFALVVRAFARDMGVGRRVAEGFIVRSQTHGIPPAERLAVELRIFEGVIAASSPADASEIDRLR